MRIGVLGTGTIASALVEGIAGDRHEITVSERSAARSARLASLFDNVRVAPNQAVLDPADVVVLGLMAEQAPEILAGMRFRPGQKVISLMAGASLEDVAAMVAPAQAAAVVLPFPSIAQGGSPVLSMGDGMLVRDLVGPRNTVYDLEGPEELAAALCAQAVLSPAVALVAEAASWLGARLSSPERGETFLRHLVASSLDVSSCAPLLEALNTPGGFNQRLRHHMEAQGMGDALRTGLDRLEGKT